MDSKGKKLGMDLTQGNISRQLLVFVLPIFLSNLVQQFYNMADVAIIGQFGGSTGTVGVSTGGEIVNFVTFVSMGFSNAVQVYISQLVGSGERGRIREATGTALTILTALSLCLMAATMLFCTPLLQLLNTPGEAMKDAYGYMMVTALGLPFIFGYNAICSILRAMGESRRPLEFILISAVSNVVLDVLFVVVLDMGSVGTAWATVIAQVAAMVASVVFMYRNKAHFYFDFKWESFRIKRKHALVLVKLGVPMAASSSMIHISQLYCNARINSFGIVASAVNSIGNKVVRFANIISTSINTGASAMIGQNIGAKKYDRVKEITYTASIIGFAMAAVNIALCVFAPRLYFRVFSSDPNVVEAGVPFMRISILTFILSAIHGPFNGVVNGSGNARLSFIVSMLDGVVLRIGISILLTDLLGFGVYGFYYGNALARLAPCVLCTAYFFSGKWKERKLLSES